MGTGNNGNWLADSYIVDKELKLQRNGENLRITRPPQRFNTFQVHTPQLRSRDPVPVSASQHDYHFTCTVGSLGCQGDVVIGFGDREHMSGSTLRSKSVLFLNLADGAVVHNSQLVKRLPDLDGNDSLQLSVYTNRKKFEISRNGSSVFRGLLPPKDFHFFVHLDSFGCEVEVSCQKQAAQQDQELLMVVPLAICTRCPLTHVPRCPTHNDQFEYVPKNSAYVCPAPDCAQGYIRPATCANCNSRAPQCRRLVIISLRNIDRILSALEETQGRKSYSLIYCTGCRAAVLCHTNDDSDSKDLQHLSSCSKKGSSSSNMKIGRISVLMDVLDLRSIGQRIMSSKWAAPPGKLDPIPTTTPKDETDELDSPPYSQNVGASNEVLRKTRSELNTMVKDPQWKRIVARHGPSKSESLELQRIADAHPSYTFVDVTDSNINLSIKTTCVYYRYGEEVDSTYGEDAVSLMECTLLHLDDVDDKPREFALSLAKYAFQLKNDVLAKSHALGGTQWRLRVKTVLHFKNGRCIRAFESAIDSILGETSSSPQDQGWKLMKRHMYIAFPASLSNDDVLSRLTVSPLSLYSVFESAARSICSLKIGQSFIVIRGTMLKGTKVREVSAKDSAATCDDVDMVHVNGAHKYILASSNRFLPEHFMQVEVVPTMTNEKKLKDGYEKCT